MDHDRLRTTIEQMKALGFSWKASLASGAKYKVRFEERAKRPDKICQGAADCDLADATDLAAKRTMAFIAMIGEGWDTRPIKRNGSSA